MMLITDSGSTKSDWNFIKSGEIVRRKSLPGINPYFQNKDEIEEVIKKTGDKDVERIHFYGAGCSTGTNRGAIHLLLKKHFPGARLVEVDTDLMGAARGLCQHQPGIACILGTGSNACVYDGEKITARHGGLGFILGDEGSGAVLGRRFIHAYLNEKLALKIKEELESTFELTPQVVLHRVYKVSFPNRYLASFAPFIHAQRKDEMILKMLHEHFREFFDLIVEAFRDQLHLPFHLTGSIAWYFREEIEKMGNDYPITIQSIKSNPMDGLIAYHLQ